MKFSTSSKRINTLPPAAANTRANASVPGGAACADCPSAVTPSSPANCRARSIHGVSLPGCGSQASPTKTPTRAGGTSETPLACSRSATPSKSRAFLSVPGVAADVIMLCIMRQLTFTQTAPLNQDADGAVRVTGSRITLDTLVAAFKKGATAEQIQDSFPSLSLRQIYGAIFYYLDHQADVEEYLKERQDEADAIRREIESRPEYAEFRERLRQRRAELIEA